MAESQDMFEIEDSQEIESQPAKKAKVVRERKQIAPWSKSSQCDLAKAVEGHESLWNAAHAEYKNTKKAALIWAEIGESIARDGVESKNKWQTMRSNYKVSFCAVIIFFYSKTSIQKSVFSQRKIEAAAKSGAGAEEEIELSEPYCFMRFLFRTFRNEPELRVNSVEVSF